MTNGLLLKLELDTNATIKAILSEMEQLAKMSPEEALDPTTYPARRKAVVRRIWALSRRVLTTLEDINADTV